MSKKIPSSLDYETLLHELALKNWRRSILEGDFPRAIQNAGQLARSRDRFWRWQGLLDLAVTSLCQGQSESAREALEGAKDCFRDVPALRAPVAELEAHFWLETGRPHRALDAVRDSPVETTLLTYFHGLALARLKDQSSAASLAAALSRGGGDLELALSRHVTAELGSEPALETLREASESLSPGGRNPADAKICVRFAFGSALLERGELEPAQEALTEVLRNEEAVLFWPIPFVRALFFRAGIRGRLGDEAGAAADARRFLSYWETGELDRERLEQARQLVKA